MASASPTKPSKTSMKKKPTSSKGADNKADIKNEVKKSSGKSTASAKSQTRQRGDQFSRIVPNKESVTTAYEWYKNSNAFFVAYCEYMKEVNRELASAISRKFKRKKDIVNWVEENVGIVEFARGDTLDKIAAIPIVAAGLTSRSLGDVDEKKSEGASDSAQRESRHRCDHLTLSDMNAKTAYDWWNDDSTKFKKYRNYIACYLTEVKGKIERHGKMSFSDFKAWVYANVGFVPLIGTRLTYRQNLLQIATVAAGLTSYGVDKLEDKFKAGEMDGLTNPNARAFSVRDNSAQQKMRKEAKSGDTAGQDVAHFVGLNVATQLNQTLHPRQKVGEEDMREIFNKPENMVLDTVANNRKFHVSVDNRVIDAKDTGTLNEDEYKRLKEIVENVQSLQAFFQEKQNGRFLYNALRMSIKKFKVPDGKKCLWDARKDNDGLKPKAFKS